MRFALLDLLAEQPLTAGQCAARLDERPANCSYHLRQFAKYGHVLPAAGGHGRERYWAMRDGDISIADDGPGGEAAARPVGDAATEYRMAAWRVFLARRGSEPDVWRKASPSTDVVSWLTAAELQDIVQGIYNLVPPYVAREKDPVRGRRTPGPSAFPHTPSRVPPPRPPTRPMCPRRLRPLAHLA